jgi:hypothetical protein
MDGNIGIPITMSVIGMGLIVVASMFPQGAINVYKEREDVVPTDRRVYHVSVKKIYKLTNASFVDSVDKPPGLWYTITKNGWIDYLRNENSDEAKKYKYLYTLSVSPSAKLYTIDSVDKAAELCKEIVTGKTSNGQDIVDWKIVKSKYDGVEVKEGVVERLKLAIKTPEYKVKGFSCMKIFVMFDVASGCIWNLNKVSISACDTLK